MQVQTRIARAVRAAWALVNRTLRGRAVWSGRGGHSPGLTRGRPSNGGTTEISNLQRNHGCDSEPKDRPTVLLQDKAGTYHNNERNGDSRKENENRKSPAQRDPYEQAYDNDCNHRGKRSRKPEVACRDANFRLIDSHSAT